MSDLSISVVIPTYNRACLVERAIASALGQSTTPREIIVVDDGSTDSTFEVLRRHGEYIKYVVKKNGGASSARNVGLRIAQGDWVAFLDSDDVWLADYLKRVEYSILATHGEADLYFADTQTRDSGTPTKWEQSGFSIQGDDYRIVRDGTDWAFKSIQPTMLQSSVIRRTRLLEIGGFDERLPIREDTLAFFELCIGHAVCAVSGVGSVMSDDADNRLTRAHGPRSDLYTLASLRLYTAVLKANRPKEKRHVRELKKRLVAAYAGKARIDFTRNHFWGALHSVYAAIAVSPIEVATRVINLIKKLFY
ncbi:MAG: glycosyltransferase family 2 protein [Pseudomonadales bacterium]